MSLVVKMVVGWFDAADVTERYQSVAPTRPLTAEEVERLQAVCDELFGRECRLETWRQDGVLSISGYSVTPEMYEVACAAHELFGMSAVDVAHRALVYPEPEWEVPTREEELARTRRTSILRGAELERQVDRWLDFLTRLSAHQRETHRRVRAYAAEHGSA